MAQSLIGLVAALALQTTAADVYDHTFGLVAAYAVCADVVSEEEWILTRGELAEAVHLDEGELHRMRDSFAEDARTRWAPSVRAQLMTPTRCAAEISSRRLALADTIWRFNRETPDNVVAISE